jgi:hypothetical protein
MMNLTETLFYSNFIRLYKFSINLEDPSTTTNGTIKCSIDLMTETVVLKIATNNKNG